MSNTFDEILRKARAQAKEQLETNPYLIDEKSAQAYKAQTLLLETIQQQINDQLQHDERYLQFLSMANNQDLLYALHLIYDEWLRISGILLQKEKYLKLYKESNLQDWQKPFEDCLRLEIPQPHIERSSTYTGKVKVHLKYGEHNRITMSKPLEIDVTLDRPLSEDELKTCIEILLKKPFIRELKGGFSVDWRSEYVKEIREHLRIHFAIPFLLRLNLLPVPTFNVLMESLAEYLIQLESVTGPDEWEADIHSFKWLC